MPEKNYAREGRIKEACRMAGVLETALDDFIVDHDAFKFTEDELPAYIERMRVERSHRFAIQTDHDAELCQRAFIAKNLTAAGALYRSVGPERFAELKAMYANGVPESEKKKNGSSDHSKNPWAAVEGNINPKTGRFTDDAIRRQMSFVRAAGVQAAAQTAAAVNCRLGDLYAAGFKSRAA